MDLSFLEQEHLIAEFQDLIDVDPGAASNVVAAINTIDNIHVKEDAETRKKELQSGDPILRIKTIVEKDVAEEKEEISRIPCLRTILAQQAPAECRICSLTDVAARVLGKVLWSDARITALDVSNMKLSDKAGAYLVRALKNNKTLVKLEMDGNLFGAATVKSLANSLGSNSTLACLNISSNMLSATERIASTDGQDKSSIGLLARSLERNDSLVFLSLWRCGIGSAGGKLLCDAVANNTRLISVEVGYNDFDRGDVAHMTKRLEANRSAWRERQSQEAERAEERERAKQNSLKAERERQKEEQKQLWLKEQKSARAELRRVLQEQQQEEKQKEEEERRQRERSQLREEERIKAKSKKGKKGEKKGKKKGK